MRRPLVTLMLFASTAAVAVGQPKDTSPPPLDAGATVYQKVVRSTAWVHSDRGGGRSATGSGSLIDKGRRLVLTNYHVVGNVKKATVYFPAFNGKKTIPDRKFYLDRAGKLGISGEVVELDKQADLALIRLDRVPDGVLELPLAADSPDPGQAVHSIGNPGKSGALWVYTPGKVRQVYSKKWKAKLDERTTASFQAKVIETDSPTNPGDSGGPLVNDKSELVGVTQGGALDADSISLFVELSEVKKLLNRRSVQALRSETTASTQPKKDDPKKEEPKRDKVLASKDDAKFFSAAAWKQVGPAAEKLFKEKGVDLVIETVNVPPKGDPKKLAAMSQADREKVFKELGESRVKELSLNGVYLLVSKNPPTLYVVTHGPAAAKHFNPNFGAMLRSELIKNFKDKKFDEGLQKMIEMTLDEVKLGDKK